MKFRAIKISAFLIVFLIPFQSPSQAGEYNFSVNWKLEIPLLSSAGAGWLGLEIANHFTGPEKCRWCPVDESGNPTLNPFDMRARKALRWNSARVLADVLSTVCGLLFLPGTSALYIWLSEREKLKPAHFQAFFVTVESVVFTSAFTQITKYTFLRRRPYAHFGSERDKKDRPANLSFVSGHASSAFSIATSTSIIAFCRNYPHARLLSSVMYLLALSTAYLRVAADKHYLTDVIAGAALGCGVAVLNTWLHLKQVPQRSMNISVNVTGSGAMLTFTVSL